LVGVQHISSGAITYALDIGTPIHFISSTGIYRGALWPAGQGVDAALWRAQDQHFSKSEVQLKIAKELLAARITHQRETLRGRDVDLTVDPYAAALRGLAVASDLAAARGFEGAAAAAYFQALANLLDPVWEFNGRERRPPNDPFNALLSYGYTILRSIVNTWIHVLGLCPTSAPLHQTHGRHDTLASDLMEPLRHLVERVALNHLRQGQIKPADFSARPAGGLMLAPAPRRAYVAALMDYFGRGDLAAENEATRLGVDEACRQMLWSLLADIRGHGTFKATRYR
jgi:CRISPR-associated endonuclease Cas1